MFFIPAAGLLKIIEFFLSRNFIKKSGEIIFIILKIGLNKIYKKIL